MQEQEPIASNANGYDYPIAPQNPAHCRAGLSNNEVAPPLLNQGDGPGFTASR